MAASDLGRAALAAFAAFLLGCGGATVAPPPPDQEIAVVTLTRALEAWRGGQSAASLRTPPDELIAADHDWERGAKLLEFKIVGPGAPFGADRRFAVELTLETAGKKTKAAARYLVAAREPRTVHREDD